MVILMIVLSKPMHELQVFNRINPVGKFTGTGFNPKFQFQLKTIRRAENNKTSHQIFCFLCLASRTVKKKPVSKSFLNYFNTENSSTTYLRLTYLSYFAVTFN